MENVCMDIYITGNVMGIYALSVQWSAARKRQREQSRLVLSLHWIFWKRRCGQCAAG